MGNLVRDSVHSLQVDGVKGRRGACDGPGETSKKEAQRQSSTNVSVCFVALGRKTDGQCTALYSLVGIGD